VAGLRRLGPFLVAGLAALPLSARGPVDLISVADPPRAVGSASRPSISADGRFVAFVSTSPDLVVGQSDRNLSTDVFLWDRLDGTVILVSHKSSSPVHTGDERSGDPEISADGNWVAFQSHASDLVPGQSDAPGTEDLFLWERATGEIRLVSHPWHSSLQGSNGGITTATVSADGAYVAFASFATVLVTGFLDSNDTLDIFLYDRVADTTTLVSRAADAATVGNGDSDHVNLSADGRFLAYTSRATNLVDGTTDGNGASDVFLYDRTTGASTLVSHASSSSSTTSNGDSLAPRISADGSWVVYPSNATDLVTGQSGPQNFNVFLYSRVSGTSTLVSHATGSTTTAASGESGTPSISNDGRFVAYASLAADLVSGQSDGNAAFDVFLYDRTVGTSVLMSGAGGSATDTADQASTDQQVSADGSRTAFTSLATNLVASVDDANAAADVFLYARDAATLELVSHRQLVKTLDKPMVLLATGNGASTDPVPSADGAYVAFTSLASDLTAEADTNEGSDVFLYAGAGTDIAAVSFGLATSATPNGSSSTRGLPALSGDGRYVAFLGGATNLVAGVTDVNGAGDVFLRDRVARTTSLVSHTATSAAITANQGSEKAVPSSDGGYVVFESWATDLVAGQVDPGPSSGDADVFLHDRVAGTAVLVSHAPGLPTQAAEGTSTDPVISGDGAYVVFSNLDGNPVDGLIDANAANDLYLYDRAAGESLLVSRTSASPTTTGNGPSRNPALDASGRYVAFLSKATDSVAGQVTHNSAAYNVFLFDRVTGTMALVNHASGSPLETGDDGVLVFEGEPAAVSADLAEREPVVSADGAFVAFVSRASDLVAGQIDSLGSDDVFLWERVTDSITLVSHSSDNATAAVGQSRRPSLSADGRYVVFISFASNLVAGQIDPKGADVFLYDRLTGLNSLVSHVDGAPTTAATSFFAGTTFVAPAVVSADGNSVAFASLATNLAAGQSDANDAVDAFLFDRPSGTVRLLSHTPDSMTTAGNAGSAPTRISADGGTVLFSSSASDLVAGDANGLSDIFVHARASLDFFALEPCRLLDTRTPSDGPALASGTTRVLALAGACAIPATARALALNVTVTQPSAQGHLTLHPGDGGPSLAATIHFSAGQTRANNVVASLGLAGDGALAVAPVLDGDGTVHLILDVTGYFQ
jgi:Tol biopolymer transport system component